MNKHSLLCAAAFLQVASIATSAGSWYIKPLFEDALTFSDNSLAAVKFNGKWGFINLMNEGVIKPSWDRACTFRCGFALVEIDGKWGYIDSKGKSVCEPKYDAASDFVNGIAVVRVGTDLGTINSKCEWIDHFEVEPTLVPDGKIPVESQFGFLLAGTSKYFQGGTGNHVFLSDGKRFGTSYWEQATFGSSNGVALIVGKHLQLAVDGKFTFDSAKMQDARLQDGSFSSTGFFDGLAPVRVSFGGNRFSEIGYVDMIGTVVIDFHPDNRASNDSRQPSDDLIGFSKSGNGLCGFLRTDGQVSLDARWDEIQSFRDGFAAVAVKGIWSVIDRTGKEVKTFETIPFLVKSMTNIGQGYFMLEGEKESTLVSIEDRPLKTPETLYGTSNEWVSGRLPISVNFRLDEDGYPLADIALMDTAGSLIFGPFVRPTQESLSLGQSGVDASWFEMLNSSAEAKMPCPVFDPETNKYGYQKIPDFIIEGESLVESVKASAGVVSVQQMSRKLTKQFQEFSGQEQLLWMDAGLNDVLTIPLTPSNLKLGTFDLLIFPTCGPGYAEVKVTLGEEEQLIDCYDKRILLSDPLSFKYVTISDDFPPLLKIQIVDKNTTAKRKSKASLKVGIDRIELMLRPAPQLLPGN